VAAAPDIGRAGDAVAGLDDLLDRVGRLQRRQPASVSPGSAVVASAEADAVATPATGCTTFARESFGSGGRSAAASVATGATAERTDDDAATRDGRSWPAAPSANQPPVRASRPAVVAATEKRRISPGCREELKIPTTYPIGGARAPL
jgi:hypothetical protein